MASAVLRTPSLAITTPIVFVVEDDGLFARHLQLGASISETASHSRRASLTAARFFLQILHLK